MSQPVVDTLQLCDALRKTGMERDQAEGVARALGKELGAHVVAQNDLQAGFPGGGAARSARYPSRRAPRRRPHSSRRATRFVAVDHKVDLFRSELGGRIDVLDGKIESVKSEMGTRFDAIDGRLKDTDYRRLAGEMAFLALVTTILGLVTTIGVFRGETPALSVAPQPAVAAAPPVRLDAPGRSMDACHTDRPCCPVTDAPASRPRQEGEGRP